MGYANKALFYFKPAMEYANKAKFLLNSQTINLHFTSQPVFLCVTSLIVIHETKDREIQRQFVSTN
jgi:hypothetical protein